MNDLQLGLLGLGAILVGAVFSYDKWQAYRHRKLAEKMLAREHPDVLLGAGEGITAVRGRTRSEETAKNTGYPAEPYPAEPFSPQHPQYLSPSPPAPATFDAAADDHSMHDGRVSDEGFIADHTPLAEPVFEQSRDPVLTPSPEPPLPRAQAAHMAHPGERREPSLGGIEVYDNEPVLVSEGIAEEIPAPATSTIPVATDEVAHTASPASRHGEQRQPHESEPAWASNATASPPPPWEEVVGKAETPSLDDEGVPPAIVSPAIDYVARFEFVEPVYGHELLESQAELLARVSKPVGWAGFNEKRALWERVVESGEYHRVRVGLLLADRRGALGETDLLLFRRAMQGLAESALAVTDLPPGEPALDAAIALDQFCANVDIEIGLNVIGRGTVFQGTKIRALAEAAGMSIDENQRFVRKDDDGRVLYSLANQESAGFDAETMRTLTTHGLQFSLDVARVSHGDRVFAQMLELARRMADVLGGTLVDDNRRPLNEAMLEPFRRQISQYQSQLAARGLHAGGPLALRLFS